MSKSRSRVSGRGAELLNLAWSSIDLDGATLRFKRTKGRRGRMVPVNPDVVDVLRKVRAQAMQEPGAFTKLWKAFDYHWRQIRSKANVPGATLHALRHSYVTRLLQAGVPLEVVPKLVGHAHIDTTVKHYRWIGDEDLRAGVAKLRKASAG